MDATAGHRPEVEWRHRILEHDSPRVAMAKFVWLFDQCGIDTRVDPLVDPLEPLPVSPTSRTWFRSRSGSSCLASGTPW